MGSRYLVSIFLAFFCLFVCSVAGQSTPTPQPSVSLSVTTTTGTLTTSTRSRGRNIAITTTYTSSFNVTYTPTPTSSPSASESASATPQPIVLETKVDPAFGVLGALLILSGIPSAFWGHKNRWTSFFLIGFYTLSLVCFVLIVNFGILPAVNPPNQTLRGLFVLAIAVAGAAGGLITIFFWKAAQYFIGAWGGFTFALWIQCFHNGGLITPIGFRWILYIGCGVVGFVLCTIPRVHYHILLISTSFVGATAFMLGVDCYTTAGLKEFYMWNIGFMALFPKYRENGIKFPVTQTMQIELGLLAAVALAGIAVQLRILVVLQRKLEEIKQEQRKRDEEAAVEHTERFAGLDKERAEWEKEHPTTTGRHSRNESGLSSIPLIKDHDGSYSPTLGESRNRAQSGLSDFYAAPAPKDDSERLTRNRSQSPGALPALDLGIGIEEDVPKNFISEDGLPTPNPLSPNDATTSKAVAEKAALLNEILTIRRSIDMLRSETSASADIPSRRHSLSSKRTLSFDPSTSLAVGSLSHARPPRETNFRNRIHSMELSALADSAAVGNSISRPTSAPLLNNDWDAYVHDRRLLQPPSGVSPPIPTTSVTPAAERARLPRSVTDAVTQRKKREIMLMASGSSSDEMPLAALAPEMGHRKKSSAADNVAPMTILPPRKIVAPAPQRPEASRVRTFEELEERHRSKMRGMQAPVTQEAREQAELAAAKERWERNKMLEKNAMMRRQNEQAEVLAKKQKQGDRDDRKRPSPLVDLDTPGKPKHSRSLSADKLAVFASGSAKRGSTAKVQDWQRYNQEALGQSSHNRPDRGSGVSPANVPFPDGKTRR
jgi:hypothetical protein